MDTLMEILMRMKPGVDFRSEKSLIDDRILNSMEVMMLVAEMQDVFDIEISLPWIRPENFQSVEAMLEMVEQIIEEE